MTEEQLQLLRSLRPHGQDEHEVGVPEARAAAEDAGLTVHLDDERQTDLAMRDALGQVEQPAGLEDALRIAMRTASASRPPSCASRFYPPFGFPSRLFPSRGNLAAAGSAGAWGLPPRSRSVTNGGGKPRPSHSAD